jgi:hypothetical protein
MNTLTFHKRFHESAEKTTFYSPKWAPVLEKLTKIIPKSTTTKGAYEN